MADWLSTYSSALRTRDLHEQAHKPYLDAYTQLADRAASQSTPPTPSTNNLPAAESNVGPSSISNPKAKTLAPENASNDVLSALRLDLSSTQRARAQLQTRVDALTTQLSALRSTQSASTASIAALGKQKAELERKLRDREEELRVKGRLVVQAQDEQVALELQLHFAEKRERETKRENEELVARWVKMKGEVVDKVNRESKWE